jgi:NTP pyrophosphatase (non-canonical NTP hydrolase)
MANQIENQIIEAEKYREEAFTFLAVPVKYISVYLRWGLLGEIGELASLVAKAYRKGGLESLDYREVIDEIGDIEWFLALSAIFNVSVSEECEVFYENLLTLIHDECKHIRETAWLTPTTLHSYANWQEDIMFRARRVNIAKLTVRKQEGKIKDHD